MREKIRTFDGDYPEKVHKCCLVCKKVFMNYATNPGNDKELFIEFQYADKEDLSYYDFKISKVAKKVKGKRIPHQDRIFLYVMKNSYRYAFIEPKWIAENGTIDVVAAGAEKHIEFQKKFLKRF